MDGKSEDIRQERINNLKEIMPEVFTEGKVDVEKLKLTLGEDLNLQDERYVLNWAGKAEAFKVLQAQSTATLAPAPEESIDFEKTQNVFIEGENLEVLKVLQKSYYGKIKMIYIDPPYNTGNDSFIYPDKFSESKDEYLKRIGDKDEEGFLLKEGLFRKNSKESGHYHSNWLYMMYPRLFLARNLLRDDGVIFVSIDDNEVHNLRMIMNEVFGAENFISSISRVMKSGGSKGSYFTPNVDFILVYAKNIISTEYFRSPISQDQIANYYNKIESSGNRKGESFGEERVYVAGLDIRPNQRYWIKCPDGSFVIPPGENFPEKIKQGSKITPTSQDGVWKWIFETYEDELKKGNIVFKQTSTSALLDQDGNRSKWNIYNKLWLKDRLEKGVVPSNFIDDYENRQSASELKQLDISFDFAKPAGLIKYLIDIVSVKGDEIVLDFFAGSGTTAHALYLLNKEDGDDRKYICVQLPEKTDEDSEAYKAGYKTIAEICKERIRRVIKKIKKEKEENPDLFADQKKDLDLGMKVFKLKNSNFKIWRNDIAENEKELGKQLDAFENPIKKEAKNENMLWEILLKSGYDLNTKVEEKKISGCPVFLVSDGEMIVCLSKINESVVKEIVKQPPKKCICLDILFAKNDQLKTNTVLQMKDAGVEFRTI